jgi:cytochrome c5
MRIGSVANFVGACGLLAIIGGAMAQARVATAPPVSPPAAAATPRKLVEGPGKDRLLAQCSTCHEASQVAGQHHDEPGWAQVMDRMVDHGAQIPDPDYNAILAYLTKYY